MEIKLRFEPSKSPKRKRVSRKVTARATTLFKKSCSSRFSKSIENVTITHDVSKDYKKKFINRTFDSATSRYADKYQNSIKKFQSDYLVLLKLYPEFPSIMMKTLVIRENGNMKAVCSFLKSRGWKKADGVKMPRFENDVNQHVKTLHFWGVDNSIYSKALEKKEIGSYFTVYSSGSYYIYFKTMDDIKRYAIPALDFSEFPIVKLLNIAKPVNRPSSINISDLIIFP